MIPTHSTIPTATRHHLRLWLSIICCIFLSSYAATGAFGASATEATRPWASLEHDVRTIVAHQQDNRTRVPKQLSHSVHASLLHDLAAMQSMARPERYVVWRTTQHGFSGDGITDNREAWNSAMQQIRELDKPVHLIFAPGSYRFTPNMNNGRPVSLVTIDNQHNLKISGEGDVKWIISCPYDHCPNYLRISHSKRITIDHITIDSTMRSLPFTQGTITAIQPAQSSFTFKLEQGYPEPDRGYFAHAALLRGVVQVRPSGKLYRKEGDLRIVKVTSLGHDLYRFKAANNQGKSPTNLTAKVPVGKWFCLHARGSGGNGIIINDNNGIILLDHINLYAAPLMACVIKRNDARVILDRCRMEPKPNTDRLGFDNADGVHARNNRIGPAIINCRILKTNDNIFNIHTDMMNVVSQPSPRRLVVVDTVGFGNGTKVIHSGDCLAIANPSHVDAIVTAKSIKQVQWHNKPACEITFDKDIPNVTTRTDLGRGYPTAREYVWRQPDKIEDFVVDFSRDNSGFIMRGCDIGENRAAVGICSAPNGIIIDNRLKGASSVGIIFATSFGWKEGWYSRNVLTVGNVIAQPHPFIVPGRQQVSYQLGRKWMTGMVFKDNRRPDGKPITSPLPDDH